MTDIRADTIYMAKVQEQTERYDGMIVFFVNFFAIKCLHFLNL